MFFNFRVSEASEDENIRYFHKKIHRPDKYIPNLPTNLQENPAHKRYRRSDNRSPLNQLDERPSQNNSYLKANNPTLSFGTSDYETDVGTFAEYSDAGETIYGRSGRKIEKRNFRFKFRKCTTVERTVV